MVFPAGLTAQFMASSLLIKPSLGAIDQQR
jgi:hypothetical protein